MFRFLALVLVLALPLKHLVTTCSTALSWPRHANLLSHSYRKKNDIDWLVSQMTIEDLGTRKVNHGAFLPH